MAKASFLLENEQAKMKNQFYTNGDIFIKFNHNLKVINNYSNYHKYIFNIRRI